MPVAILMLVTLVFPAAIQDEPQTIDIVSGDGPRGILEFRVENEDGQPMAARLSFLSPSGEIPDFGNRHAAPEDLALRPGFIHTLSGRGRVTVGVGSWTVWVSHGLEWSASRHDLTISEGQVTSLTTRLQHQVDTEGWVSADFHLHTLTYSGHGDSNMKERIISIASEGLEVAVATDHNHRTDYQPTISELGASGLVSSIVGDEVSVPLGHFNAFPLKPWSKPFDTSAFHGPTLFKSIREHDSGTGVVPVIQVNHPRWEGIDYFAQAGLDPITGSSVEARWSNNFDSIEIFNENAGWGYYEAGVDDRNTGKSSHSVLMDWHNLLNRGIKVAAVGNSDSHTVSKNLAGYPRNYIVSPTDDPAKVEVKDVAQAVRKGQIVTTSGPFVDFRIGEKGLGDLVAVEGNAVPIRVQVQAASWIDCDRILVVVDGDVVETIDIPQSQEPLRIDVQRKIPINQDGWIAIRVEGDDSLAPIVPDKGRPVLPLAITNPIWLDTDGDGVSTAPLDEARARLSRGFPDEVSLFSEWQLRQPLQRSILLQAAGSDREIARTLANWGIEDSNRRVRISAFRLIERLQDDSFSEPLEEIFDQEGLDQYQRVSALRTLAAIGASKGVLERIRTAGTEILGSYSEEVIDQLPGQWIRSWQGIGWYPIAEAEGLGLDQGPETDPDIERRWTIDGEVVSWQPLQGDEQGRVDLNKLPGARGKPAKSVAIIQTFLHSPDRREVTFTLGTDDGCRLWFDGKLLIEDNTEHGINPVQHISTLTLEEGSNRVLIEVANAGGGFGARMRILDPEIRISHLPGANRVGLLRNSTDLQGRMKSDFAAIRAAAELYFVDRGRWPEITSELATSGYLDSTPTDPWNRPYQLEPTVTKLTILSLGADGLEGGIGIDADWHDGRSN